MKFLNIVALSVMTLCLTQTAMAATDDGHYTLRVSTEYAIPPGAELSIYFDVLNPGNGSLFYDVHCDVSSNSRIHMSASISSLNQTKIVLNGHQIYMDGDTFVPGNSTLDILNVNALNDTLTLHNEELLGSDSYFGLYAGCVSTYHKAQ